MAQIDLHSHLITPDYLAFLKKHNALLDEGFPIPPWDEKKHIDLMNRAGIQTAVLTMPAPQPYFGDTRESAAVCRRFNEEAARITKRNKGRFLFCAALPLPDVNAAIQEAKYAIDVLGADGVKLATNSYGQYLGDPALDSLMAFLNERGAVVILHPHKPSMVNARLIADVPLASYEYLAETTRTILNMIAHNVMVRFPKVKFVVPHCGALLPTALPRFRALLPVMASQGIMQPVDIDANMKNLYFDLAGNPTGDVIDMLLTITTPDHLLYGSDYPYVTEIAVENGKKALAERLPLHGLKAEDVFSNNARRLLGSDIPKQAAVPGGRMTRLAEIEVYPENCRNI